MSDTRLIDEKTLILRPARDSDEFEWKSIVSQSPNASPFHAWEWRAVYEMSPKYASSYWVAEHAGKVVGVFPLTLHRAWFGGVASSLFFGEGGPLVSLGLSEADQETVLRLLVRVPTNRLMKIIKLPFFAEKNDAVFDSFSRITNYAYAIPLSDGLDGVMKTYDRKRALYVIRRAEKMIQEGKIFQRAVRVTDAEDIFQLYQKTLAEKKADQRLTREMVHFILEQKGLVEGSGLWEGSALLGFALWVPSPRSTSYFIGAGSPRLKELGLSLHPLLHVGIESAIARGNAWMNLAGAPNAGLKHFKASLGGKRMPYSVWIQTGIPLPGLRWVSQKRIDRREQSLVKTESEE